MTAMNKVEVLRAACCIAGADGEIDEQERALLERMAKGAGVGAASLKAMIDRAERDQNFFQEQFKVLSADPGDTMTSLCEVALADGRMDESERAIMQHFAKKLEMDDGAFEKMMAEAEARGDGGS